MTQARAIKIAITAIGGQGGGVLAGWIGKLGECNGYIAQTTSVPGVAQRTGATIYYIELFPESEATSAQKSPVLALSPVPGDLDIVVAAELAEAGRALVRGFVTDQTVLITSSHRDYAIGEKSGMGDGRLAMDAIIDTAKETAKAFVHADMSALAQDAQTVISAVLFGAVAGSDALPFTRDQYEEQIRNMGRAVEANLRGFASGFDLAKGAVVGSGRADAKADTDPSGATPAVQRLIDRMRSELPEQAHAYAFEGLKRTVRFQDVEYADSYLDRLGQVVAAEQGCGAAARNHELTTAVAKHLAVWMCYDDAVRVADQKIRKSRFERVRDDIRADADQIFHVSEYMHPRVEEICDILPRGIAGMVMRSTALQNGLKRILGEGKRISTTKLRGYLPLYILSLFRGIRRSSFRFAIEQRRIEAWLKTIVQSASQDYDLAVEVARMQRLLKGYGDTHHRGLESFDQITDALSIIANQPDPSGQLKTLCNAALADEEGHALNSALSNLLPDAKAA